MISRANYLRDNLFLGSGDCSEEIHSLSVKETKLPAADGIGRS